MDTIPTAQSNVNNLIYSGILTSDQMLRHFEDALVRQGLNSNTISVYKRTVKLFPNPLTSESFDQYITDLARSRRSNYTNYQINVARKLGKIEGIEWLKKYPMVKNKGSTRWAYITEEEIISFFQVVNNSRSDTKGESAELAFYFCAYTGCRPSEALKLTKDDIEMDRQIITFRDTKTGDSRTVIITEPLYLILKDRIKEYPHQIFIDKKTNKLLTDRHLRHYFRERVRLAKIPMRPRLAPYSFRHSFATRMDRLGTGLRVLMLMMGHKKADTTMKYTHPGMEQIRQAMESDPLIEKSLTQEQKIDLLRKKIFQLEQLGFQIDTFKKNNKSVETKISIK